MCNTGRTKGQPGCRGRTDTSAHTPHALTHTTGQEKQCPPEPPHRRPTCIAGWGWGEHATNTPGKQVRLEEATPHTPHTPHSAQSIHTHHTDRTLYIQTAHTPYSTQIPHSSHTLHLHHTPPTYCTPHAHTHPTHTPHPTYTPYHATHTPPTFHTHPHTDREKPQSTMGHRALCWLHHAGVSPYSSSPVWYRWELRDRKQTPR